MGRSALVTGGAGFLGSHIVATLLASGYAVTVIDNLSTGRRQNIAPFLAHARFCFVEGNVCDGLPPGPFHEIWNFASPASPVHYGADPVGTLLTNVLGMRQALDCARASGARVLQASTSEVYGDPAIHPQTEAYWGHVNPVGPRACYDEGKRAAETLCADYRRVHGVDVRVVRIFNTYGPGMASDDGRVVSNFIVRALRGEPLTVYGSGQQSRSFCYRDDLVEGCRRLMALDLPPDGAVNLGNPVEISMLDLARLVLRLTGSAADIVHYPLPTDDPRQRCPDIGRARQLIDWAPGTDLETGLGRTIAWFRGDGGRPVP